MLDRRIHITWLVTLFVAWFASIDAASAQVREAAAVTSATNVLNEFVKIPNRGFRVRCWRVLRAWLLFRT